MSRFRSQRRTWNFPSVSQRDSLLIKKSYLFESFTDYLENYAGQMVAADWPRFELGYPPFYALANVLLFLHRKLLEVSRMLWLGV